MADKQVSGGKPMPDKGGKGPAAPGKDTKPVGKDQGKGGKK